MKVPDNFYYTISTTDEVYFVMITKMFLTSDCIEFDVWCPENPIFNKRMKVGSNSDCYQVIENHIIQELEKIGKKGLIQLGKFQ